MAPRNNFNFEISLSVLNHLGRNLYRNSITVLGEAISNSWDADAKNVWIAIDHHSGSFTIKDDGTGMDARDFQGKFLKIGYTKRANGKMQTPGKRPFIGAKGIGKLALLSCADRITIFSKKKGKAYVGGTIDNSGLDKAITHDLTPDQYPLEMPDTKLLAALSKDHESGTIIIFQGTKEQIRSSVDHIRKMLALYFRFSILDEGFSIYVNDDKVGLNDLTDLLDSTEFAWIINKYEDEFITSLPRLKSKPIALATALGVRGFIATVEKPRNLKITGTEERATLDLFVNGRLREKNILRHIPSQRIIESYLYGQIHFDKMDKKGSDPFTSSREGIVEGDKNFAALLKYLKEKALPKIFDTWDDLRLKRGEEGDDENSRKSKKERKARDLYNIASGEYSPDASSPRRDVVDGWLDQLRDDAEFNIGAYVDCFLSENLARRYIAERTLPLSQRTKSEADQWREREAAKKTKANLSYGIRKNDKDIDYLGMDDLAFTVEGKKGNAGEKSLTLDAIEYAPVRNVVGHTGLLTANGKSLLSLKHENIKARIKTLVAENLPAKKKGNAKKGAPPK
ncbi:MULTISPECIES: ATP-binding protein [unclassified Bradyrhizobium]|uniref:ATP-binding protein n=1 Tax=unclassified Bradyrhizobium TaxID=2631580 RepID=UPI0028E9D7E5|nr:MULTISPECIES: ATP-binding protein [unclassified Bradyrhizobium]